MLSDQFGDPPAVLAQFDHVFIRKRMTARDAQILVQHLKGRKRNSHCRVPNESNRSKYKDSASKRLLENRGLTHKRTYNG
jgi:hypothetical protein